MVLKLRSVPTLKRRRRYAFLRSGRYAYFRTRWLVSTIELEHARGLMEPAEVAVRMRYE